jgi:hypothetical protein
MHEGGEQQAGEPAGGQARPDGIHLRVWASGHAACECLAHGEVCGFRREGRVEEGRC